ncbi:HigA family addiction module antidote protein [Chryseobacterium indologenes]|uniref:HigA family addiction module antitoxin n=1 Tax=Chryseobacterium indologenes TaxID=253 RepID=UPI0003E0835E|nr:HigA family addiction module antitoxin [Chryseobacterium indologenes]QPQ50558.1 HigA family addiction module antidote protein [Chryseobacterium indologenes]GAE63023.1 putative antitoxin [Chryseobacterium indologenes NBRC 14944]SFJ31653.1 transcriptional regulator, XRE family [Chryseobacterium indologenes]SUX53225.1 Uncharacterized HTH-type transcriptional regulator YddM [Chryseobacterium indologenes]
MTIERHKSINVHAGEVLREFVIEPAELTVGEASTYLDVTRVTLSNILNGKSAITPNMALRISYVFGGTPDFWLRLQRKYDLMKAEIEFEEKGLKKFIVEK